LQIGRPIAISETALSPNVGRPEPPPNGTAKVVSGCWAI
jgi:hypothetical protein